MMKNKLLAGENSWLSRIVSDPANKSAREEYAQWLTGKDEHRAEFLRNFDSASQSMDPNDFPDLPNGVPNEWIELVGYHILKLAAVNGFPELKSAMLKHARPGLRMIETSTPDNEIELGTSKIGGLPDLPNDFVWPIGKECKAIYNDAPDDIEDHAGFMLQIRLDEIADTFAGRDLPETGLLSFFCYVESDNPDVLGVKVVHFHSCKGMARTPFPERITEGNGEMPSRRLTFEETLDLPGTGGPWEDDMEPDSAKSEYYYEQVFCPLQEKNQFTLLGYGKSYQERDPTPSKNSRHLLMVENADGEMLHIQIPESELVKQNFDAITLEWVDFD